MDGCIYGVNGLFSGVDGVSHVVIACLAGSLVGRRLAACWVAGWLAGGENGLFSGVDGTFLEKYGFVQEGRAFLEQVWLRARGAHIS